MQFEVMQSRLRRYQSISDRIIEMRRQRARKVCAEAGLDPDLLGIHPHNAMCSYEAGKPWPGINYSKVRLCLRIQRSMWDSSRIVERFYARAIKEMREAA